MPSYFHITDLAVGGLASIKKAEDSSGQVVILKLYHLAGERLSSVESANYKREVEALTRLSSACIIGLHSFREAWTYTSPHGVSYLANLIELDYCPNGDLFDLIAQTSRFSEPLARCYFQQILLAVGTCHEAGIVHRDLKPENLLLDDNFDLKLADFGSALVQGVDTCAVFGTTSYLPPEEGFPGSPAAAIDLYSCGVILFFMLTRELPYTRPSPRDSRYMLFRNNKSAFWGTKRYLSAESCSLIEALLQPLASARATLPQVLAHPWLAGKTLSPLETREEMTTRRARIRERLAKCHTDAA